jgi:hypothetical protein
VRLRIEVEGFELATGLPGEGAMLVSFMSFAAMRGFGAQHPLIALADRLHRVYPAALGPLTTFYGAALEDDEDERRLELAWQDAGALGAAAEWLEALLAEDGEAQALARRAGAPGLAEQAAALAAIARQAEGAGARVRLSYAL